MPIFVCAMAFPTVPCPLHVFEPCYWLMIQRCLEMGTRRSGMCLSAEHAGIPEYDCTLAVKDIRTFSYGGSIIDAIGISRFWVLSHHHRDGYNRQTLNTWKMKGWKAQSARNSVCCSLLAVCVLVCVTSGSHKRADFKPFWIDARQRT